MAIEDHELGIGDVAQRTGLSVHALRFYEREGLMSGDIRRVGGRRRYRESDVQWLGICMKLRASGMPLATIRQFAELVRQGTGNERQRLALLREHRQNIAAQVAELNACLEVITWKVRVYEQHLAEGTAEHLWATTAP